MPPIRRYLRITKYSVLEVRIYLDNPHLAETWLLNPRHPILPLVIESVRPLVLPKLREENDRKRKGGKKKSVKDTVVEDDFEVSIFLTESSTRHSLLTKHKHFRDVSRQPFTTDSGKLTGNSRETALRVEDAPPIMVREESGSDVALDDIPSVEPAGDEGDSDGLFVDQPAPRRSKRARSMPYGGEVTIDSDDEVEPMPKRSKSAVHADDVEGEDEKKKMALDTTYDGFSIYGRVLCLIVRKRDRKGKGIGSATGGGQAMMEDWIASTQMPVDELES